MLSVSNIQERKAVIFCRHLHFNDFGYWGVFLALSFISCPPSSWLFSGVGEKPKRQLQDKCSQYILLHNHRTVIDMISSCKKQTHTHTHTKQWDTTNNKTRKDFKLVDHKDPQHKQKQTHKNTKHKTYNIQHTVGTNYETCSSRRRTLKETS